MLANEMRSQGLLAGTHQAADDAGEFALITGKPAIVCGFLVLLGEMCDHRGSLVTAKIARYARKSLLISRHRVGEHGILFHFRFASAHDFRHVRELVPF